jgi:hypothetical protein
MTGDKVKVYLLLVNNEQFIFYSDESEPDESPEEAQAQPRAGIRGWLEERWHRFQMAFHQSEAGAARSARRTWEWLHSLTHPEESMLVRFRSTRRICLHHPASRSKEAVEKIWRDYLASRGRRHLICLTYNALIAPAALALLWPLPGPNLIGYWFAYRAIHHWLIVRGIRSVKLGWVPTHLHPEPALDSPVERDPQGKARHAVIEGDGHRLDDYLNWNAPPKASTDAGTTAEAPDAHTDHPS